MLEKLVKLPLGAAVGFLLGIAAVWIIQPETNGGIGLIIVVCIVFGFVVGRLLAFLFHKKPDQDTDEQA